MGKIFRSFIAVARIGLFFEEKNPMGSRIGNKVKCLNKGMVMNKNGIILGDVKTINFSRFNKVKKRLKSKFFLRRWWKRSCHADIFGGE
jgi:filamentous hemagglutinin family protein